MRKTAISHQPSAIRKGAQGRGGAGAKRKTPWSRSDQSAPSPLRPCAPAPLSSRGFTLIEVIVVVTIIAVLAALIAPRLFGRLTWAKAKAAKTEVKAIETAVNLYLNDTGEILTSNFDLERLLVSAEDGGGPQGPYFSKAEDLVDPWENPYVIRVPGEVNYDFDIISWGPDLEEGTEDDIVN